jgi:hypothetical protein
MILIEFHLINQHLFFHFNLALAKFLLLDLSVSAKCSCLTSGRTNRRAEKILLSPFLATQSSAFADSYVTTFANAIAKSAGLSIKTCLGFPTTSLSAPPGLV